MGKNVVTEKTIKLIGINGRFIHSCLALFYIRNELENSSYAEKFAPEIVQFTINDNYYEMLLRLSDKEPDYIFFSAAIWNSSLVERLIVDLKNCLPACGIVVGGPQATVIRKRLGKIFCTVVLGEIEAVGERFYEDLALGKLKQEYSGSFFNLEGRKRTFTSPYKEADFTTHLKNRYVYYESSRGCPFSCTYCLSAAEKGLYHKELLQVKKELRLILKHQPKVVKFIDRTFNDIPPRALEIWQFLLAEGGETLFHFEMAPDRFDEEILEFLAKVPTKRFQFEIGIQSTNPQTLESVDRPVDIELAKQNIKRLAQQNNIHLHVDLILGLPYETRKSFADSFRMVYSTGAHYIQMGLLKILPSSPICNDLDSFGYTHCMGPPYTVLENKWLTHSELKELYWFSECVEKFINNRYFITFWTYLRNNEEDIFQFFQELLSICRENDFFLQAPTQELLSQMLVERIAERNDRELLVEILRYDWLRCSHRFLPDCLKIEDVDEQPAKLRSSLYQSMPQEIKGVYKKSSRNQFFRKSYFLRISKKCAQVINIYAGLERPCLCFSPIQDDSLYGHSKVIVLQEK